MSLATHRTQASAARKRGGGLARRYLLASLPMGRPAMPPGGETKSLCRAAAGIFLPQSSACAAVAYPTTGVRRAQELSLSLRSPTPPAAQLAKGYSHLPRAASELTDDLCSGHAGAQLCALMLSQDGDCQQQLPLRKGAEPFPVLDQSGEYSNTSSTNIRGDGGRRILQQVVQGLGQGPGLRFSIHSNNTPQFVDTPTVARSAQP